MFNENFRPHLVLRNPHIQTLLSYTISPNNDPGSTTELITLRDGDQIALELSQPINWQEGQQIVLMMPGTGGTHQSPYLIRLTDKLVRQGFLVARLNFRGMATAFGKAKKISHGGSTQDVQAALEFLRAQHPQSKIIAAGFSLSGNILLKLAGEQDIAHLVSKIIAVCPPVNLAKSSERIERFQNRIYLRSILKTIVNIASSDQSIFEYQPLKPLSSCKTLKDFDELFTAPSSGFKNAMDYYQQASSLSVIQKIQSPCHILFASDDPLIDYTEIVEMDLPSNINLTITKYGGHMGFLKNFGKNRFWMDEQIIQWINQ